MALPFKDIRLVRGKVGGHYSLMVTWSDGTVNQADLRPGFPGQIGEGYDLVEAPDPDQNFETMTVMDLKEKGGTDD